MKAMIFAAGRGERMRPLTDHTPKPLLHLAGQPIIVHTILSCKTAGIREFVINVSYKSQLIMDTLGKGDKWGVALQYSEEGEPALETAGGIIKALPLLGDEPFLAISGDIWTNYDFSQLFKRVQSLQLAHCVMVNNPDDNPQGDLSLMPDGRLSDQPGPRFTYGNIGLFHPALFENLPVQRLGLGQVLRDNVRTGQITGEVFTGKWFNIGTAEILNEAQQQLKEALT